MSAREPLSQSDVERLSARHQVSPAAIEALASALAHSGGRAAQFSHPELGGMGQWMSGGMLMIGDMFNNELKAKVDRICQDVARAIVERASLTVSAGEPHVARSSAGWWPPEFGTPSAVGAQNAMRYAFFPSSQRLVLDDNGSVTVYETGEHVLTGVSQQQSATQSIAFSSASGPVPLTKLKRVTRS